MNELSRKLAHKIQDHKAFIEFGRQYRNAYRMWADVSESPLPDPELVRQLARDCYHLHTAMNDARVALGMELDELPEEIAECLS